MRLSLYSAQLSTFRHLLYMLHGLIINLTAWLLSLCKQMGGGGGVQLWQIHHVNITQNIVNKWILRYWTPHGVNCEYQYILSHLFNGLSFGRNTYGKFVGINNFLEYSLLYSFDLQCMCQTWFQFKLITACPWSTSLHSVHNHVPI